MKEFFNPTLPEGQAGVVGERSRMLAVILGFFFGTFGVHQFVLGYTKKGAAYLIAFGISWGVFIPTLFVGSLLWWNPVGWVFLAIAASTILLDIAIGICSLITWICILTNKEYIDVDGKLLKD